MLAYAAKGTRDVLDNIQGHNPVPAWSKLLDLDNWDRQLMCGKAAEDSLHDAKDDIFLTTFTNDSLAIGTYQAGIPELVLAVQVLRRDLRCRDGEIYTVNQKYIIITF